MPNGWICADYDCISSAKWAFLQVCAGYRGICSAKLPFEEVADLVLVGDFEFYGVTL